MKLRAQSVTSGLAGRELDERELQFDVRRLESGDPVEVLIESEHRWVRGTFRISTCGDAWVDLSLREPLPFERALFLGLKRILH